jgi:hypothetical protein
VRSSAMRAGEFSPGSVLPDPGGRGVPAGGGSVVGLPYLDQESRPGWVQLGQHGVDCIHGGVRGLADLGLRLGIVPFRRRASATPRIPIWSYMTVMGSVIAYSGLHMSEAGERRRQRSRTGRPGAAAGRRQQAAMVSGRADRLGRLGAVPGSNRANDGQLPPMAFVQFSGGVSEIRRGRVLPAASSGPVTAAQVKARFSGLGPSPGRDLRRAAA